MSLCCSNLYLYCYIVGQVSTLSDHCPVRAVIRVKARTDFADEDYNFIESPSKLKWDKDIAYRFENILQSPEYLFKADNLSDILTSQEDIDQATQTLTDLLVEGTLKADISGNRNGLKPNRPKKILPSQVV